MVEGVPGPRHPKLVVQDDDHVGDDVDREIAGRALCARREEALGVAQHDGAATGQRARLVMQPGDRLNRPARQRRQRGELGVDRGDGGFADHIADRVHDAEDVIRPAVPQLEDDVPAGQRSCHGGGLVEIPDEIAAQIGRVELHLPRGRLRADRGAEEESACEAGVRAGRQRCGDGREGEVGGERPARPAVERGVPRRRPIRDDVLDGVRSRRAHTDEVHVRAGDGRARGRWCPLCLPWLPRCGERHLHRAGPARRDAVQGYERVRGRGHRRPTADDPRDDAVGGGGVRRPGSRRGGIPRLHSDLVGTLIERRPVEGGGEGEVAHDSKRSSCGSDGEAVLGRGDAWRGHGGPGDRGADRLPGGQTRGEAGHRRRWQGKRRTGRPRSGREHESHQERGQGAERPGRAWLTMPGANHCVLSRSPRGTHRAAMVADRCRHPHPSGLSRRWGDVPGCIANTPWWRQVAGARFLPRRCGVQSAAAPEGGGAAYAHRGPGVRMVYCRLVVCAPSVPVAMIRKV